MTTMVKVSLLQSINDKLSILEMMHADIKELKTSLEFTQSQTDTLQAENKDLKLSVSKLTADMETVKNKNKLMKETILDLQSRSMHNNLVFSGITEQPQEDPEHIIIHTIRTETITRHRQEHNVPQSSPYLSKK